MADARDTLRRQIDAALNDAEGKRNALCQEAYQLRLGLIGPTPPSDGDSTGCEITQECWLEEIRRRLLSLNDGLATATANIKAVGREVREPVAQAVPALGDPRRG